MIRAMRHLGAVSAHDGASPRRLPIRTAAQKLWPGGEAATSTQCACGGGCPRCQAPSHDPHEAKTESETAFASADVSPLPDATRLQPKLKVGEPDDEFEREADRAAEQVVRMAAPPMPADHAEAPTVGAPLVQRRVSDGGSTGARTAPSIVNDVLSSPGEPLDAASRAFFEPRFGQDFSHVYVHADGKAAASARAVNAQAYAVGSNIVFAAPRYAAGETEGRRLMAHELTHVVQQKGDHSARSTFAHPPLPAQRPSKSHAAPVDLEPQPAPSPVAVHGRANGDRIFRSEGTEAGSECFTNTKEEPPAKWDALKSAAKGLPDEFKSSEDTPLFRNKGAIQLLITYGNPTGANGVTYPTSVYPFHASKKGADGVCNKLRTELGALKLEKKVRFSETSIFSKPHNEGAMQALQHIILDGNQDLVWSVTGYVFTFYAPCDTCKSFLSDPPIKPNGGKPMYVGSLCVPGGYESPGVLHYPWVAGNKPFTETGPSYSPICSDNPNYEPAKKLKQNADGKEQGWVNFTVKDEPCGEPEDGSGAGEGQIATPPSCPSFKGKFHYVDPNLTQQRPLKLYTAADEASDSGKTIPVDTLVCQIDRPGAWWKVRPVTADKEIDKVWWVESRYLACCKDAPEGAAQ